MATQLRRKGALREKKATKGKGTSRARKTHPNGTLHISFILDETGSMLAVKDKTISGFNEYLATLRADKKAKQAKFTLTKFNSEKVEIVHDAISLSDVLELTQNSYQPNWNTPLYDAVGRTLRALEGQVKSNGKVQPVLVVIQTDGQENASKEYTRDGIFALIDEKKKAGWTFAFLGADQDAWLASAQLGIAKGNTMSYASAQTPKAFQRTAQASVAYAVTGGVQTDSLFTDDDEN